jgi:hypothetical protein
MSGPCGGRVIDEGEAMKKWKTIDRSKSYLFTRHRLKKSRELEIKGCALMNMDSNHSY